MAKYLDENGLGLVWGKIKSKFIAQNSDVESGHVAVFTVDDSGNNTIIGLADGGTVATSTHAHGNITNGGAITATGVTIANGDALTIVDSSASGKLVKSSITFDGSTTSKYLSQAGTWVSTINSHQDWGIVAGAQSGASNASQSDPYINLVKGSTPTFDSGVQLKGGGIVGVSANSGAITITASHATHKLTATNGTATAGTNSITYVESLTGTNTATSGDLTVTATRKTLSDIVTGSGLTANTIILGNGSGAVQTSGKTIETSVTANSDDKVPTSQAVASYVSTQLGSLTGALVYKGTIASSGGTVTDLPASHAVGDVYVVATAGTYAGKACEVGDMVICNKAGTTASNSDWTVVNGENQVSQSNSEFTTDAASKAFAVVDGTTLNLKVTHHTPSGGSAMSTTAGTAVGWSGAVITGLTSDGKGHITGVTTGTIPANPAKDGRMTISANGGTAVNTLYTANVSSATNAINFVQGTGITTSVAASSGTTSATVTITHADPGEGTDLSATNTDTTTYTNGGEYTVVTGVTITKDGKGHVTGLKETRQTIKSSIAQYSLPVAKYNTLGGIKPAYTTTGAATGYTAASNTLNPALSARTTTAGRYYAVEADKNGVAFVNVPWTSANNAKLQVKGSGSSATATDTGFTADASNDGVITFARSGASVSSITTSGGTVTINGVDSLKNPNSFTVGTKPSASGTATNVVTYDGSASGKAIYFSTAAKSNTNVQFAVDANGFITGTVTDSGNTLNTAGSTDTSSKIFLIGATSQADNPQTYSHDTAYVGTDGCLYSNNKKVMVAGDVQELDSDDIDRICV